MSSLLKYAIIFSKMAVVMISSPGFSAHCLGDLLVRTQPYRKKVLGFANF
jgi:hypothetical protein